MILEDQNLEEQVQKYLAITGRTKAEFYEDIVDRELGPFRNADGVISTTEGTFTDAEGKRRACIIIGEVTMYGEPYIRIYDKTIHRLMKVPAQSVTEVFR